MTATPTKTARHQLDDLLVRLETKAEQLLLAEVWDDQQIELVAMLRYTFAEAIGRNEVTLTNYLSTDCGMCGFTGEDQAKGVPFQADQWGGENMPFGFEHDYFDNLCDDYVPYLPEGWVEIPCYLFGWNVQPCGKDKILDYLDDAPVNDFSDLLEADVLGDDRELCGEALVMTGYLTNQENLTGDDLTFLQVYKVFRDVLEETLANQEEG